MIAVEVSLLPDPYRSRVEISDAGCWLWCSEIDKHGYGVRRPTGVNSGRSRFVHRQVYELLIGPIPKGLVIDHLCRVTRCCNPAHLEPVTHAENLRRSEPARRTMCPHGHAYTPENTRIDPRTGKRKCRACHRERERTARRGL